MQGPPPRAAREPGPHPSQAGRRGGGPYGKITETDAEQPPGEGLRGAIFI